MQTRKTSNKDLYYTSDHEWIDFQGSVAYVGVCQFKLLGFKDVHQITFQENSDFKKKSEVIATITYNEYKIEIHMPVDGRIVQINENLLSGDQAILLQQPEGIGWIVKIVPSQPYERKDLLLPKQYQMTSTSKYAKK